MSELGKITTQQRFNRVQEDLDLIYNRLKETADELQDSRALVAELEAQTPSALKAKLESAEARIEQFNDILSNAMDTAIERDTFREVLESIRDSFSQMSDNTHSNTAYALATQALDPKGCAEMAKLPWPPDEQIVADLKAIDQSH